jgi:hypothetical protein
VLQRWTDYRRRQREALRESYRTQALPPREEPREPNLIADTLPLGDDAATGVSPEGPEPDLDNPPGEGEATLTRAAEDEAALTRAAEDEAAVGATARPDGR